MIERLPAAGKGGRMSAQVHALYSEPELADGVAELDDDPMVLLRPGEYRLRLDYYQTAVMFGRAPKLVLWFTVLDYGENFEKRLPRFYNVKRLIGRPSKAGRFKVGPSSLFVREYARLFHSTHRLDRMPMSKFREHIIVGSVRTVHTGSDQKVIPETFRYSVIDELIRLEQ